MSDNEKMRAEFEAWADQCGWNLRKYHGSYYWAEAARGWQVWQAAYAAGRKAEQAEVERLRAACNKYSEDELLQGDWKARALKAETELAAAKAASVCPVRVLNIFECVSESDRYIEMQTDAEADTFTDWLRDRIKERGGG